jgi:hypothetical protein
MYNMAIVNFIASVNDKNLNNTKGIAEQLKKKPCVINGVFEEIGTISGSFDDKEGSEKITELKIKGLDAIEVERKVRSYKRNSK